MYTRIAITILLFFLIPFSTLLAQDNTDIQEMEVKKMDEKDDSFYRNGLTVKALLMDYQSQKWWRYRTGQ